MNKIKITEFAERHFDRDFGGTKILNMTKEEVDKTLEEKVSEILDKKYDIGKEYNLGDPLFGFVKKMEGYAPFCKLIAVKNFTDARVGSMPITLENYQYLRSGYSARRESELPVFSRWLELPLGKPRADYLVFVLYSKEQIDKESKATAMEEMKSTTEHFVNYEKDEYMYESFEHYLDENGILVEFELFDADWGVVAILGQSHNNEEPMKPETMLRNALGKEEGGSGVELDREKYLESVEFWSNNATVK